VSSVPLLSRSGICFDSSPLEWGCSYTLLDLMRRFEADSFLGVQESFFLAQADGHLNQSKPVSTKNKDVIRVGLEVIRVLARQAQLPETMDFISRFESDLDYEKIRGSEVFASIRELKLLMENELSKRIVLVVDPALNSYFKADRPLGDAMFDGFPSARFDLSEAGTCLACGTNVAATFHLMRAVEVGMRELGRDRQIPCAQDGSIEFQEWGRIIGQLESATKEIQQWTKSQQKEEAHKFYNAALWELRSFNDGWRRHAAHVRPAPEMHQDEALALLGHVSRFFQRLATKISEGNYTPLRW